MNGRARRALVIGHRGGVGATLLQLLAQHRDLAQHLSLDALFFVDLDAGPSIVSPGRVLPVGRVLVDRDTRVSTGSRVLVDRDTIDGLVPTGARVLDSDAAADPESLARTLRDHRIDQVIEVADVDTAATSAVCSAAGADYVSASIMGDAPTLLATRALLSDRPDTRGTSQLLGAGMNPGVVNALVLTGIDEFARRAGVEPAALDLYAIHVTEDDTTALDTRVRFHPDAHRSRDVGGPDPVPDEFAMSWSPEHALEELLEPRAMYVDRGGIVALDHRPCDALYTARCGDHEIAGMVVPHEELISIGARFPGVETAFFYAIPGAAAAALRRHPDRSPSEWRTRRLYGPGVRLVGRDRVGVLLASRTYGELWIGYEHAAAGPFGEPHGPFATFDAGNGTLLQAAAGVLAGWSLLGSRTNIHSVDELDTHAYLVVVESILGSRRIVHAPAAIPRALPERRALFREPSEHRQYIAEKRGASL